MSTPVIFRRTKDAQIVAFFPTLPGQDHMPDNVCEGYSLKDGKCFVDLDLIRNTSQAKYSEYLPLLEPMAKEGYSDIKVAQRVSKSFNELRVNGEPEVDESNSVIYTPKKNVAHTKAAAARTNYNGHSRAA